MSSNEIDKPSHGQFAKLLQMAEKGEVTRDLIQAVLERRVRDFLHQGEDFHIQHDPDASRAKLIRELGYTELPYSERSHDAERNPLASVASRYKDLLRVEGSPLVFSFSVVRIPRPMNTVMVRAWHRDREERPATSFELLSFGRQHKHQLMGHVIVAVGDERLGELGPAITCVSYAQLEDRTWDLRCDAVDLRHEWPQHSEFLVAQF